MLSKLLRWTLVALLVLLVLAGGLLYSVNRWLEGPGETRLHDYLATAGLEITAGRIDLSWWADFPRVSLRVDSLRVRDTLASPALPPLLSLRTMSATVDIGDLLRDTLHLRAAALRHGHLHLQGDSLGNFNAGSLLTGSDTTTHNRDLHIDWAGVEVGIHNFGVYYDHPLKDKRIAGRVDSLRATLDRDAAGALQLAAEVDIFMEALAFNTKKGAYLSETRLTGPLAATFGRDAIGVSPTELDIGGQRFRVAADIRKTPDSLSHIYLSSDAAAYDRTRRMLHDTLKAKLADYDVSGTFPVEAHIATQLTPGYDPEVRIHYHLRGQDVRLMQYEFTAVRGDGFVVNRLTPAEGGIPNSRKNVRLDADSLTAYFGGVRITSPHVTVAAAGRNAILRGPLRLAGPNRAISRYLGNTDFFFERGSFDLGLEVDASLLSFEELVYTTAADLRMRNLDVRYQPAGARFGFDYIELAKTADDITFRIQSERIDTGLNFQLIGDVDDIAPLVLDRPGQRLTTKVALRSPHVSWIDFVTYFGEDGLIDELTEEDTTSVEARRAQALKATLRGLNTTFSPKLSLVVDTLAYYDVLALHDFATGLHFERDTLVLEETSFDWAGSELAFGARVGLSESNTTPFSLVAATEHLDLNALRPTLEYFGLRLPRELDTLPSDLKLDFAHRGTINDTFGIMPGANAGALVFNDGRDGLFSGQVQYAPGPRGLATELHLDGDPHVVNVLFRSENFFFSTGHFSLDVRLPDVPDSLQEVIGDADLRLRIDSTQVSYPAAGVYVPVEEFAVDYAGGHADYALYLNTDSTDRHVLFHGEIDNLRGFLYPEHGGTFRICTDATARSLSLEDLRRIVRPTQPDTALASSSSEAATADTAGLELQELVSATGGIFANLRPDLSLLVDTFFIAGYTPVTDISAALRMRDATHLVIEETGFDFAGGRVNLAADYRIDRQRRSPFIASYLIDSLDLELLLAELRAADVVLPEAVGNLAGVLSSGGTVVGMVDERGEQVMLDSMSGKMEFALMGLELNEWPALQRIGRKTFMRRRFERLAFAPLTGVLTLDTGIVRIPRLEVQSTGLQLFAEGSYDLERGPDLLISVPLLRNIGRGRLTEPPAPTGLARSGWNVYMVAETDDDGEVSTKFRLGRRRYYRERGRLEEWRELRRRIREERRGAR